MCLRALQALQIAGPHRNSMAGTVAGCGSAPSTPCAQSYMERTVWDGDQVLAEIRAPGGDEVASSAWESDSPSYTTLSGGTVYGRVTYTHALGALGIDAPVAVTRTGLSEGVRLVFPHANWRGEVASGSVPSSGDPCGHGAAVCPAITWPGRALATDGAPMAGSAPPVSWWGSLMERKRDGSGLQYMRNRYYDAATGKFTQVDPVGIAGGVNLYGFAEGDPVNYSDPLGLCPEDVRAAEAAACVLIEGSTAILGSVAELIVGGGGGALTAVPTGGLAAPVTVPAGAIAGAGIGGVAGKLTGEAITNALFSKGGGRELRGGRQSQRDPDHDRLMKEFRPDRRQRTRIHEEIAKQKKGSGDLEYDDLRQIFIDITGRNP